MWRAVDRHRRQEPVKVIFVISLVRGREVLPVIRIQEILKKLMVLWVIHS